MEELSTMMKREELSDKIWNLIKGWGDKRILNFFVNSLPIHMIEDTAEQLEKLPAEEITPHDAWSEGHRRSDLLKRMRAIVGEDQLNFTVEDVLKEFSIEAQMPALEEFVTKLENMGGEKCKTWRSKLVSIGVGLHPDAKMKMSIYGYFKCDIDKEELESCHRAWQRQKDFDFEVNLPEGVKWKLDTSLRECPDKIAENAGWTRYLIGDPV